MEMETEDEVVVVVGTLEEQAERQGEESMEMQQQDGMMTGDIIEPDESSIIFSESQLQESLCAVGQAPIEVDSTDHEVIVETTTTTSVDVMDTTTTSSGSDAVMSVVNPNADIVVAVLQEVGELPRDDVTMDGQQLREALALGEVMGTEVGDSEGVEEVTDAVSFEGVLPDVVEEQKGQAEDEEKSEQPEETLCNCLSCQEVETERGDDNGTDGIPKVKCLICYTLINSPIIFPSGGENPEIGNPTTDDSFGKTVEQHIADILNAEDAGDISSAETQEIHEPSPEVLDAANETASGEPEVSSVNMENVSAPVTEELRDKPLEDKAAMGGEEESVIKLPIIFQILGCTIDEVDKEIEAGAGGLLETVPLCVPCQSVVSDAILIFKELQRLEKSLGVLRESMKDQIVKSYEANYCCKKKRNDVDDIVTIMGQVDVVRRAIISEGVSAAKILSSFKGSKRAKKKKTTIVSKSALYPQVNLTPMEKRVRSNKRARFDDSGVKKEEVDTEYNQYDDEFVLGLGDPEEKEEPTFLQTHSGRRVRKPNYRKWLLADEEDEEVESRPQELDVPASPKSEPEWSPGHSEEEEGDIDSDSETSGDSEIDSEEDRRDLDELGKLLDQGERFDDIETGKRVVRARRKKKQNSTNPNRIKCTECPRTFADETKKEIHFRRKHTPGGVQAYQCEKCSKLFRRPGLLRKHMQKQHGEPNEAEQGEEGDKKRHMCDFCGQKYRNASELRIHVRLHTGETPYKCEHCDKSFVSSLKREFHIEQSHWEIPPLKCEFCPKAFFRQHRLRIHRISHTGEKAYLCEICSQSFSHPTYLKYHQGQHAELNLETFKCKDCGKTFANPTNLRLHVKTVHLKQFRFTCEVCNMGFTHMSHKRIHMRGHTGERPYKCELCNESFRYRDRLRIHMRGHTGERPFVCEICKKGFASKSKLKRHEKIHEKNQPSRNPSNEEIEQAIRHRCEDCGKGFAEPQHLSAHRRYCQRKSGTGSDKEEKKNRSNQSAKTRTVTITGGPVAKQVEVVTTIPQQVVTQAGTQQTMLVPLPVNYAYPVTYTYEVPQYPQQPGVREYQYQN